MTVWGTKKLGRSGKDKPEIWDSLWALIDGPKDHLDNNLLIAFPIQIKVIDSKNHPPQTLLPVVVTLRTELTIVTFQCACIHVLLEPRSEAYVRELVLVAPPWRTSQPAGLCLGYSDVGGGFIQCILPNPEMTAFSIPTNNDSAECLMVFVWRNWKECKTPFRINYLSTVKWPSCFKLSFSLCKIHLHLSSYIICTSLSSLPWVAPTALTI